MSEIKIIEEFQNELAEKLDELFPKLLEWKKILV